MGHGNTPGDILDRIERESRLMRDHHAWFREEHRLLLRRQAQFQRDLEALRRDDRSSADFSGRTDAKRTDSGQQSGGVEG